MQACLRRLLREHSPCPWPLESSARVLSKVECSRILIFCVAIPCSGATSLWSAEASLERVHADFACMPQMLLVVLRCRPVIPAQMLACPPQLSSPQPLQSMSRPAMGAKTPSSGLSFAECCCCISPVWLHKNDGLRLQGPDRRAALSNSSLKHFDVDSPS